jgi:hypothetical protein
MFTSNLYFISWYVTTFGVQSTIQEIACEIETCPCINDDHDLDVLEFDG